MDEEALVRALLARLARGTGARDGSVEVPPGDDAAVVAPRAGTRIAATTDAMVEAVHFDLAIQSTVDVGWKLVESNLSDLAAMGAEPRWLLVAVEVPAGRADDARAAVEAAAERCDARGVNLVGGNVSSGPALALTATALGELDGPAMRRSGARPGDGLWLTGPTGSAALGLATLRAGRGDDARFAADVDRFRRPEARIDAGRAAAVFAHAAIDVSDGLSLDLSRLCEASAVGARVRLSDVPDAQALAERAALLGLDADALVAGGGEDYELLAAFPPDAEARAAALGFTRIGVVVDGDAIEVRARDGAPYRGLRGWVHRT